MFLETDDKSITPLFSNHFPKEEAAYELYKIIEMI